MIILESEKHQDEFLEKLSQKITERALKSLHKGNQNHQVLGEELLSPHQTSNLLFMSIPTLNALVARGILNKYRFPGSRRVYFIKSEIIKILKENKI